MRARGMGMLGRLPACCRPRHPWAERAGAAAEARQGTLLQSTQRRGCWRQGLARARAPGVEARAAAAVRRRLGARLQVRESGGPRPLT